MNRTDFLAAVHELAEQLGRELYDLVAAESERVRAAALEVATAQLRSAVGADDVVVPELDVAPGPGPKRRAPIRCRACGEIGHNARRHRGEVAVDAQPDQPPPIPEPVIEQPAPEPAPRSAAPPSPPLHAPTDSPASRQRLARGAERRDVTTPTMHRVLRPVDARNNVPPPGWTAEDDRREEYADISVLAVLRKAR